MTLSSSSRTDEGKWFVRQVARPEARVRLFCLPYAGAGASAYRLWQQAFDEQVELSAVQLPGRENRFLEEAVVDPEAVAEALAAAVTQTPGVPWAVYGHSLGARVGFEAIRCLRRAGGPQPVALFAAAARAPHLYVPGPFDGLSEVSDEELVARIAAGGGVPEAVLAEPELLELLLPALRCDFTWLDTYEYLPEDPIAVPIVGLAGVQDRAVTVEQVDGWAEHTSAGFTRHLVDGGHFFLHERAEWVTRLILTETDRLCGKGC